MTTRVVTNLDGVSNGIQATVEGDVGPGGLATALRSGAAPVRCWFGQAELDADLPLLVFTFDSRRFVSNMQTDSIYLEVSFELYENRFRGTTRALSLAGRLSELFHNRLIPCAGASEVKTQAIAPPELALEEDAWHATQRYRCWVSALR